MSRVPGDHPPPGAHPLPASVGAVARIGRFFDGLELVEPGLVTVTRWRHEENGFGVPPEVDGYGAVGRKP